MSRTNTSPDQIGEDCSTSSPLWDLQTVDASFDRDCEHSHSSSVVLRPHKPAWVGWQPWFYLRLKGLWLCWVVRGGIWCPVRLSAVAHRLTRLRILTLEPERSETDEPRHSSEMVHSILCAQAACAFSCSGSKRSPFFQTIKLMAAILRARVSLAISGFIPFPSRVS